MLEPPLFTGLGNYRAMWDDPTFWRVVKNTGLYALVSIPLYTIVALVLAALLNTRIRFARLYQACVFLPTLVPLIASAMIWFWLFNGEYGLINRMGQPVLDALRGLLTHTLPGAWTHDWANAWHMPLWLIDPGWVLPAMVVMSVWGVGQAVVIYIAAMQDVPRQLYEAARLDGMGSVRQFLHVTLPMVSPSILFNVIALSIAAVQIFAVPYVMFRRPDGQNPAGHYYSMYLYENAFIYGKMGYASAMAWLQLVFVLVLTGVMMYASRKLVHYTRV